MRSPTPGDGSTGAPRVEVTRLLQAWDLPGLAAWAKVTPGAARVMRSVLFAPDPGLAWRAAEASGCVAAARAPAGLEPIREQLRRILWLMNDESGGLLWLGPPVVGAILAWVPALAPEWAGLLPSFLEEEPFRAGTRWALWRLAAVRPDLAAGAGPALAASLTDPDPAVRGHAALALRAACPAIAADALVALRGDPAPVDVFDFRAGVLVTTTVGALASGALAAGARA